MVTIPEIENLYNNGASAIICKMIDGDTRKLRLFKSASNNMCYYGKNRKRYGYTFHNILSDIESIKPVPTKTLTSLERYIKNLESYKRAFTQYCHPNLWSDLQEGYRKLDINAFLAFIDIPDTIAKVEKDLYGDCKFNKQDSYHLWHALRLFTEKEGITVIHENHYKTTTLNSNKYSRWQDLTSKIEYIKQCIDNKTDFHEGWRGNYDVSVSGNMGKDGIYRGFLSLEYKNCGNGHYYLLINENQAVFAEDD